MGDRNPSTAPRNPSTAPRTASPKSAAASPKSAAVCPKSAAVCPGQPPRSADGSLSASLTMSERERDSALWTAFLAPDSSAGP